MNVWVFPSLLSAGTSLLLAAILYRKRKDGPAFIPLILVMFVTAWIHGLNATSMLIQENPIIWKQLILLGEIMLPVLIGYVSHSLLQTYSSNPEVLGRGWWWRIMAGGAAIFGMLVIARPDAFMQAGHEGAIVFKRPEGPVIWGFILCALFLGLSRLEQIFRSFRDPLRHRLKHILIGLGGLACISMAQGFHLLLVPVWKQDFIWAQGVAAWSSILLMSFGLGRWRLQPFSQKVHISHQAFYASLTVVCVGGYLVLVGMVAMVIQQTGWEVKESLEVVLIFLAVLTLVVVMLSRQARAEFQQFVSRHFSRSKYDYRDKWLEVTETFSACKDIQEVWNRYLEWLSRTFIGSRVTIWKHFDVDGRYHQIRKERRRRKWTEKKPSHTSEDPSPILETHPVILEMKARQKPVVVQESQPAGEDWDEFLQVTQAQVCVPLMTGDRRLLGFCTLGKKPGDTEYDQDDFYLLRSIAHHVTMLLVIFQLQEERNSSAKWEAVHRFSGFYMHDLKNLASTLSMVVQNAEQYTNNQEFQDSAMRTVRNTSQRIIELMGELASQSKEPHVNQGFVTQPVDMNLLITETLAGITGPGCHPNFHPGQEVPLLRLEAESMKQVLLNLILNARQATGEHGTIDILTAYDGDQVIVEIVDSGEGMSSFQLENLFQPFKSSKKNGLGVGLFQCKRIVEDHQGMIHIESREGRGTTVILTFPTKPADKARTVMSGVSKSEIA